MIFSQLDIDLIDNFIVTVQKMSGACWLIQQFCDISSRLMQSGKEVTLFNSNKLDDADTIPNS